MSAQTGMPCKIVNNSEHSLFESLLVWWHFALVVITAPNDIKWRKHPAKETLILGTAKINPITYCTNHIINVDIYIYIHNSLKQSLQLQQPQVSATFPSRNSPSIHLPIHHPPTHSWGGNHRIGSTKGNLRTAQTQRLKFGHQQTVSALVGQLRAGVVDPQKINDDETNFTFTQGKI